MSLSFWLSPVPVCRTCCSSSSSSSARPQPGSVTRRQRPRLLPPPLSPRWPVNTLIKKWINQLTNQLIDYLSFNQLVKYSITCWAWYMSRSARCSNMKNWEMSWYLSSYQDQSTKWIYGCKQCTVLDYDVGTRLRELRTKAQDYRNLGPKSELWQDDAVVTA